MTNKQRKAQKTQEWEMRVAQQRKKARQNAEKWKGLSAQTRKMGARSTKINYHAGSDHKKDILVNPSKM